MNTSSLSKQIQKVSLEDELKQSYLDYAMSVIVGRALPDVRDGLKPVHRRVLYAMHELGNDWNKPYKKSARVVGDVIGKYHPHGDSPVYDTIVRMAQSFSLRYMLVDGQGNFGSVDGDEPAAMRYTEVRMSRVAHLLLEDLEKQTVDFVPNYDGSATSPVVLPARLPNLLVNGSSGIAVGMATNIPPHNLSEVIDACIAMAENPDLALEDILRYIPGPDFPTAGIIHGRAGILEAYRTGRGRIQVRGRTHLETDEKKGRERIIVTELPYQVNKARLVERIAGLVREKKLEGITALRDESDKQGMRVVIELRRGENTDVVLNNLYVHTQLQSVYGINMVALLDGQPRVLNIHQVISAFLTHRREVVTRRTLFDLKKARDRVHILQGLAVALVNIDAMITLIKSSRDVHEAKSRLLAQAFPPGSLEVLLVRAEASGLPGLSPEGYRLSPEQAQSILEMRLHRLTGLEQDKILAEHRDIQALIASLEEILASADRLMAVIREELTAIRQQFGDARKTEIIDSTGDVNIEDLMPREEVVVTLSHHGYAKAQPVALYQAQHRGGRGKSAVSIREEDFVEQLLVTTTHDTILCFSSVGKVYWLKVYQFPLAGRNARGKPVVNLLPLTEGEKITAILPVQDYAEDRYVFMATACGVVKKVSLADFSRPRASGIIALELPEEDRLIGVDITDGSHEVMLFTDAGKVIRFTEDAVRCMGRTARGVRGVTLQPGQTVVSLVVIRSSGAILTATTNGFGKRTPLAEYRSTGRGGQGVISIQVNERNGKVVCATQVQETDEVVLVTDQGTLVRMPVAEVSQVGRNTQGVRLINLANGEGSGEKLVALERVVLIGQAEEPETTGAVQPAEAEEAEEAGDKTAENPQAGGEAS